MPAGNIADIRFGRQISGKGTPLSSLAATDYGLYFAGGNVTPVKTVNEFEETTSDQIISDLYTSETHVEGEWEVYVPPKAVGALLYGVLGAKSVTGAADPWTHTFTFATSRPWWTMFRNIGGLIWQRFSDCRINRLALHGESYEALRATIGWQGISHQSRTSGEATPDIETSQRFLHYDGKAALLVEGTAVPSIRSWDIDINRNSALVPGDDVVPIDIQEGRCDITASVTKLLLDASLYNRFWYGSASPSNNAPPTKDILELAGSPAGIEFLFTRVAAAPGPERSLKLAIPRLAVTAPYDLSPNTSGEAYVEALSLRALKPGAGSVMTGTLKNGAATIA